MLEIGSGTGEHAICFAKALPNLVWLPSDPDEASRASIDAWIATEGLTNVACARRHRRPTICMGRGGRRAVLCDDLPEYGSYRALGGSSSGSSPARGAFCDPTDFSSSTGPSCGVGHTRQCPMLPSTQTSKRRDPRWGIRDVDDLVGEAAPHGLDLREVVAMPVNNLSLVFVKASPAVPA